jgi:hypothetical protein
MPFSNIVKEDSLVRSRRCCCLCNEFSGTYVNVHHIVLESEGGPNTPNTIENSIVLCLKCHGEVGHYNEQHPIGNKYTSSELIRQRDEWWDWCKNNPNVPLPKYPISISPSVLGLPSGAWHKKGLLYIYNQTDRFYYQIWIKISIDEIQPREISVKPISEHEGLTLHANSIDIRTASYCVDCVDQSSKNTIYLVINSLEPHTTNSYEVSHTLSKPLSNGKSLYFTVASFSETPSDMFESAGKAAMTFIPPENLTAISFRQHLRRN